MAKKSDCKVSNEQLIKAIKFLKQAGFQKKDLGIYTMLGLPGQTENNILKDMGFIFSLGAQINLASYALVPQTEEWINAIQKRLITPDTDLLLLGHTVFPAIFSNFSFDSIRRLRRQASLFNRL